MGADTSSLKGTAKNEKLSWLSNLSPGYVMKLKEKFEYASDDFTLDKMALKTYFKCSDRECSFIFEHFDQDGNGKIDSYEFICAMALLSQGTLDDKAELIFSLYDFDGNKFLTKDELVILMTNVLSSLKALKKQAPPQMLEIEAKVDEFFKKADTDGDQLITLKEFKNYIKTDKDILEVLLTSNVATREDLGKDYGTGTTAAPATDPDLDEELNPKGLLQSEKKLLQKEGSMAELDGFETEEIGAGDQFMAVKPFAGVIKNSVPSKYKPSNRDSEAPDATLQLEYIHGYRCHDTRSNLRYTATGEIVYHAAAVGIVLNQKTNQQRFVIEHNDDILCMAIDPSGKYCATGQLGPKPLIVIWDNDTMEVKHRIQGPLLKGIKSLAFSPDGKYLAASAFDDDHCIAVYAGWNAPVKPGQVLKPLATGKGTRANIMSLGFNPESNQLIATCMKEVNFFAFNGGILKGKKGTGLDVNAQAVLCQAYQGTTLYTGLFDGRIATWTGTQVKDYMKGHTDGCHSLYPRQNGLISGGGDGLIIIWQSSPTGLTQAKQFDLKAPEIKSLLPKVRSVCENPATGAVLVGTRGGEIVEFGGPKPQVFLRSHHTGELWGLATHPQKEEYITVGQDNFMAIWDIKTRKQRRFGRLEQSANVVEYSRSGNMLAIGYINGCVQVLQLDQGFAMKANKKDRKEAISEIKFSPDDSILAVGAHDSLIKLYSVAKNFALLRTIRKNLSTVSHFDFSLDGRFLVSNSTSYEILYFDVATGNQITGGASQFRDETWSTYTCHLGWAVQGIWPPCADGSDINAVDRSPEGVVTATADDFGMVKLFKHPSPVERAAFHEYRGHSSHVTNVRFLKNSPYLISTGGEDKCVFQWRYTFDKESADASKKPTVVDVSNIADDLGAPKVQAAASPLKTQKTVKKVGEDDFEMEEVGGGDQRLAVLPFKGQVEKSKPTGFKQLPKAADKPEGNLKLLYAHGFRSFDTRNNLKYVTKDDVVFSTAALGVVLNKPSNTQKFFNMHPEDIVSLAIHPSKDIVATGQMAQAGRAKQIDIFVWRISTMQMLAQLNNFHQRAVRRLEFSPAGDKLLSIGEDDQNSVAIYDWANKKLLCKSGIDPDKVFDVAWANETEFATVGMKCVKFFTMSGANLTGQKGLIASAGVVPISCIYAFGGLLTGGSKGELIQWSGRSIGKTYKRHTDALWCLQLIQGGQTLVTGGNDAKIILWDKTFNAKQTIDLAPMSKFPTGVRSLDYHEQAKTFLVGTRGAEIIEVSAAGAKMKTLIYGHYQSAKVPEVWGCAVHPTEQLYASCGSDCTIRIWNQTQMVRASDPFQNDLTALDWSSDGKFIIAGDRMGFIHLIDPTTLKEIAQVGSTLVGKSGNAWVEDLKISPDNSKVVFGSHGGLSKLEIVEIIGGKQLKPIKAADAKMTSALTHLDWSQDSRFVVVNSQAYELMFIDVANKKQLPASSAKDIQWQTWTCVLGFPVQGIWPPFSDFTDVNAVCRSQSQRFLATAEDSGLVKLFRYPCTVERAQYNEYRGHSSHVTKVKFSADERYVITTGGNDKTVIVWETDFGFDGAEPAEEEVISEHNSFEMEDDDLEDFQTSNLDRAKTMKLQAKEAAVKASMSPKKVVSDDNPFEEEDVGIGNEAMAIKPWKGQSVCPSTWKKPPVNQTKPPGISLQLEWIHGYRARDSRNNIGVALDGSIVYQAAAVGVCYDPATHTQRHFQKHTDDVTAIAFSPDRTLVATGEVGPAPKILIWDAVTMQLKTTVKHKLTKGIQSLAFSPSGKTLAAVAIDVDHTVAAISAETGATLAQCKGDTAQILDIAMKDDTTFSTTGVKHYTVWTLAANNITAKRGNFGDRDPKHAPCAYSGEFCLTGAITGEVYIWSGPSLKQSLPIHSALVDSIHVTPTQVFTGGKDNKVNVLSAGTFAVLFSFPVDWGSVSPRVRALCLDADTLYVGTYGCEIFSVKLDLAKKAVTAPKLLVNGHYSPSLKDNNEVWGLCLWQDKVVTVSDDATLRVWDPVARKQVKCVSLLVDEKGAAYPEDQTTREYSNTCKGRTVDVSPNGKLCAVGFRDGTVRLFNTADWKQTKRWTLAKPLLVQDLKFSPNGQQLAVSSHDMQVYVYSTANFDQKPVICKGSTSGITHVDWSADSKWLHTNDLSYEILFYDAQTGLQDKRGATARRDEQWATWTLPQGWPVQSIWPLSSDGSDINAVDVSAFKVQDEYQLVASADDQSLVKVFRYPCVDQASKPLEGIGHSSHVTNVKFSKDGKRLYSAGGNDTCLFQWALAPLQ